MATAIKTKKGVIKLYNGCSEEVRQYFEHLPRLLAEFPMEVSLAYVFSRLEKGQNAALYFGAVRVYKVNCEIARNAISVSHMTRDQFPELYKNILSVELPKIARDDLSMAEQTRDKVMHGKLATEDMLRNAIARVLEYAEQVNDQLNQKHKLRPFGSMRGISGKASKLDKKTSRLVLKGLGFHLA